MKWPTFTLGTLAVLLIVAFGCSQSPTRPTNHVSTAAMELGSKRVVHKIVLNDKTEMSLGELHNALLADYYATYGHGKSVDDSLSIHMSIIAAPYVSISPEVFDSLGEFINLPAYNDSLPFYDNFESSPFLVESLRGSMA